MEIKQIFAERLKKLREEKSLSQSQLAEEVNVSRGSISFYENRERLPDIETLHNLCRYFDITADYLIGLSNYPTSSASFTESINMRFSSVIGSAKTITEENAINTLLDKVTELLTILVSDYNDKDILDVADIINSLYEHLKTPEATSKPDRLVEKELLDLEDELVRILSKEKEPTSKAYKAYQERVKQSLSMAKAVLNIFNNRLNVIFSVIDEHLRTIANRERDIPGQATMYDNEGELILDGLADNVPREGDPNG